MWRHRLAGRRRANAYPPRLTGDPVQVEISCAWLLILYRSGGSGRGIALVLSRREVDHTALNIWAAVIDPHAGGLPSFLVDYLNATAKREGSARRRHRIGTNIFAGRSLLSANSLP
jgi:hypothetical protein